MLFYQLLFLFRSYTFILLQEMIFFKRKSTSSLAKSTAIENNKKLLPPPPSSLKQQQATHTYIKNSSDSLLQLNLLDNFSSIIDIPQLQQGTEEEKSVVHTLDTCSLVSTITSTIGNRTSIYAESINKIDPERIQPPSILSTDHQLIAATAKPHKEKAKEEDTDNTKMNEGLNVSDSLMDPEGDIKHTPDNWIVPLSLTKEPDSCCSDIKASKEKQDELAMYSDTVFDDNNEKEVASIPSLSGDVPQLEAGPPSFDCVNEDSPTLPPTNTAIESNEFDEEATDDKTFAEEKKPETDQLSLLYLRSETEVGSLEISLHEIQDLKPILSLETATNKVEKVLKIDNNKCETLEPLSDEEEKIVLTSNEEKCKKDEEEEEKKSDMIVKQKSTHSLIPRKQNLHPVIIEQPTAIQKPLSPSQSTTKEFNVNRRGSSGSFIPIPQQNRLSFTMAESKHWSPSSSSDSLSLHSSASSSDSITKKKESLKRLPGGSNQSSKIPVFATKQPEVQKVVPSMNNTSRLPVKRTPTTAI